ncbi:MAG: hypothetical protein MO853_09485 [Candidatus Protistobacter heckmanni]|nr:hypothetical protein [Candidatus Protistobacter heckmanni]
MPTPEGRELLDWTRRLVRSADRARLVRGLSDALATRAQAKRAGPGLPGALRGTVRLHAQRQQASLAFPAAARDGTAPTPLAVSAPQAGRADEQPAYLYMENTGVHLDIGIEVQAHGEAAHLVRCTAAHAQSAPPANGIEFGGYLYLRLPHFALATLELFPAPGATAIPDASARPRLPAPGRRLRTAAATPARRFTLRRSLSTGSRSGGPPCYLGLPLQAGLDYALLVSLTVLSTDQAQARRARRR